MTWLSGSVLRPLSRSLPCAVLLVACGNMPDPPAASSPTPRPAGQPQPWVNRPPPHATPGTPGAGITLSSPPPMIPGGRQALLAGTAGRAFQWSTSNPEVAAVDPAGVVHGVGPGLATITATRLRPDGSTETISTAVTVRSDPAGEVGRGHRLRRR